MNVYMCIDWQFVCVLTDTFGFHRQCTLRLVYRIQIIGRSYIAQMEWPRIVPREVGLCIYLLYVCYNAENKQQQQQQQERH